MTQRKLVRKALPIASSLLPPAAFTAATLALWSLGADMNWAGSFPIDSGAFSHWLIWMALAGITYLGALRLRDLEQRQK
jgi:hypothetical protein